MTCTFNGVTIVIDGDADVTVKNGKVYIKTKPIIIEKPVVVEKPVLPWRQPDYWYNKRNHWLHSRLTGTFKA